MPSGLQIVLRGLEQQKIEERKQEARFVNFIMKMARSDTPSGYLSWKNAHKQLSRPVQGLRGREMFARVLGMDVKNVMAFLGTPKNPIVDVRVIDEGDGVKSIVSRSREGKISIRRAGTTGNDLLTPNQREHEIQLLIISGQTRAQAERIIGKVQTVKGLQRRRVLTTQKIAGMRLSRQNDIKFLREGKMELVAQLTPEAGLKLTPELVSILNRKISEIDREIFSIQREMAQLETALTMNTTTMNALDELDRPDVIEEATKVKERVKEEEGVVSADVPVATERMPGVERLILTPEQAAQIGPEQTLAQERTAASKRTRELFSMPFRIAGKFAAETARTVGELLVVSPAERALRDEEERQRLQARRLGLRGTRLAPTPSSIIPVVGGLNTGGGGTSGKLQDIPRGR